MVLKRCIYGVDLNPLAVELAKVSLWLHCFTLGAPLSFLDHHLRCGNSLIGVTVDEVREKLEQDIFGSRLAGLLRATELMCKVGALTDSTFSEVKQSVDAYREAAGELGRFKAMLDTLTAESFGVGGAASLLRQGFSHHDLDTEKANDLHPRERRILTAVREIARDKRFFHWELEFPEVWYRAGSRRDNPGFDAVVGNPPYGSSHRVPQARNPQFIAGCVQLPPDWYFSFTDRGLALLRSSGAFGMIVPQSWETGTQFAPFRVGLARLAWVREVVNLPFDVFKEAYVDTCLLLVRKDAQEGRPCKWREMPKSGGAQNAAATEGEEWDIASGSRPGIGRLGDFTRWDSKSGWIPLGSLFATRRGVRVRPGSTSAFAPEALPLWVGKAVHHVQFPRSRSWVRLSDLVEGPRDEEWYRGARLWLRRIVGRDNRVLAVLVNKEFVVKKDFYILKPETGAMCLLPYLGILNSRFFSFLVFQGEVTARKDDFRQASLDWLRRLPLPIPLSRGVLSESQEPFVRQRSQELVAGLHRIEASADERLLREASNWVLQWRDEFVRLFEHDNASICYIVGLLTALVVQRTRRSRESERPARARAFLDWLIDELVFHLYGITPVEKDLVLRVVPPALQYGTIP